MAGEWTGRPLEDCMAALIDYRGKTPAKTSFGVPLITAKVVKGGRINPPDEFIAVEDYETWMRRGIPKPGDVVITTEAPLGEVAQLGAERVALAQRLIALRGRQGLLDNGFLKFLMQSEDVQEQLRARASGTTVLGIKQSELRKVLLTLPPINEQRAIAHILGTLDDKIDANLRMNKTLEAMARTLFKSWFVDFHPVRAKAERRDLGLPKSFADLFPDSFQDSELGEIPRGWRISSVGHLCRSIAMGPFGSDIKTDNFVDSGVPVIRGGNLTNGFVEGTFAFVSDTKADQLRNANAFPGDIVITHRGTLGQVGLIPEQSLFPRYVVSQSQMVLSVDPQATTSRYLYDFLCSASGQHALLANTSQTGVPAIARPTSSVRAIQLVAPSIEILKTFGKIVDPIYKRCNCGISESRALAALRDALLPKLLSGELRVKDAERYIEVVGS